MLKDTTKLITDNSRVVIAKIGRINPKNKNALITVSVYKNGSLDMGSVITISYNTLCKIYDNIKEGKQNQYIQCFDSDTVTIQNGKYCSTRLQRKEIYNLLIQSRKTIENNNE